MISASLKVVHHPLLIALGSGIQLLVDRSLEMSTTDDRYQPVLDYIIDHGMVLVERTVSPKGFLRGQVEQSWYATPETRNLILMGTDSPS